MNPAPLWRATVELDNSLYLSIQAPLAVVIEAMGRVLHGLPAIHPGSVLRVEVRPA